jgi:Ca2+-transporting ATPase
LLVAQILWIHLICDGPADIVLGFEPREDGVMDSPPRRLSEPVLDRLGASLIAAISVASAAFALGVFGYFHLVEQDAATGRSIVFAGFCINSLVYLFSYRSLRKPLTRMNPIRSNRPLLWAVGGGLFTTALPFAIPPLGALLEVVPLALGQCAAVLGFALLLVAVVELAKHLATVHRNL